MAASSSLGGSAVQTTPTAPDTQQKTKVATAVVSPTSSPRSPPPGLILAHVFFAVIVSFAATAAYDFASQGEAGVLETMAFYGVYHSDPINQAIHFVFVPFLLWSMFIIMAHAPLSLSSSSSITFLPGIPAHTVSWATLAWLVYVVFYALIDVVGALCYAPVLYGMYATAVRWHQADQLQADQERKSLKDTKTPSWTGTGRLLGRAWILHVLGWYMQIHPGHRVFEGSQPAIAQSLGGALTSAPLFAFYEGVWALGIRQDLQQKVLVRVGELRGELCDQGVNMRKCPIPVVKADIKSAKVEL